MFGLAGVLAAGLVDPAGFGTGEGLAFGLVGGLVFGLVGGVPGGTPQSMVLRRPKRHDLRPGLGKLVFGFAFGFVFGFVFGLVDGLRSGPVSGLVTGLSYGLLFGLVLGLPVGLGFWLLGDVWSRPSAAGGDVTPHSVYRKDYQTRLISGLGPGLVFGLIFGYLFRVVDGPVVGIVLGLVFGLTNGAVPLLLFTEIALLGRRRPVRFMSLLETARDRQVLRQAGAVYQFRHADLQDRLADRHRREHMPNNRVPSSSRACGYLNPAGYDMHRSRPSARRDCGARLDSDMSSRRHRRGAVG